MLLGVLQMANPLLNFIDTVCVQTAVYWERKSSNGYGGFTYETPVEIKCRWDANSKLVLNDKGEQVVISAEILVNQELDVGGLLFLGTLDDLDSSLTHEGVETHPIIAFPKNPLFKSATEFVRMAYV